MRIRDGGVGGAGLAVGLAAVVIATGPARAEGVQVHGFVSQGAMLSTGNDYLAHTRRGSVEFFDAGLNFSTEVVDRLRVGVQIFARDLGPLGDYSLKADWAYLDYRWRPWLGLRAGRIKLPFGLYNEYSDIDSARLSILLPQSLYPTRGRDFTLAQTGFSLYGAFRPFDLGLLEYQLGFGTIFVDAKENPAVDNLDTPYVAAGQVFWRTPLPGLRIGGSAQALRLSLDYTLPAATAEALRMAMRVPPDFDGKIHFDFQDFRMYVASLEFESHGFLLAAEYGRYFGRLVLEPDQGQPPGKVNEERFYGLLTYRFTGWLEAGAYYSIIHLDAGDRNGDSNPSYAAEHHRGYQRDLALSVRFDVNDHWLFKLEAHYLVGTASLQSADIANTGGIAKLAREWGLFLFKTTVTF